LERKTNPNSVSNITSNKSNFVRIDWRNLSFKKLKCLLVCLLVLSKMDVLKKRISSTKVLAKEVDLKSAIHLSIYRFIHPA
jgi:hypothetical protein